jgi:hypothetical protein
MQYSFVKSVNSDQLANEIRASAIVTALDYITTSGDNLDIFFKATLSSGDETILNQIVNDHVPATNNISFVENITLLDNGIPSTPVSGQGKLFVDSSKLKFRSDNGSIFELSNINELTEKSVPLIGDELMLWSNAHNALRKIKVRNSLPTAVPMQYVTYDEDDFIGTATGKLGWTAVVSGTGASAQTGTYGLNGTEKAHGVLQIDTGTTSTGRAALSRLAGQVQLGYAEHSMTWRLALEALSTDVERFLFAFGFYNNSGTGLDSTHGVYFRYRDDLNGGQWQCVARQAGAETVVDTSVAANTQYNIFRIDINQDGNQARFYINDSLVATITTNIPTTQGNVTGIMAKIEKTIGITQRNVSFDYFHHKVIFEGGRQ